MTAKGSIDVNSGRAYYIVILISYRVDIYLPKYREAIEKVIEVQEKCIVKRNGTRTPMVHKQMKFKAQSILYTTSVSLTASSKLTNSAL